MKKILSLVLVASFMLLGATLSHAEFSKTAGTGTNYTDSQVFLSCYYQPKDANRPQLTKNSVCILATGSSLVTTNSTLGIYVTTTDNRHHANVIGVADADIASGTVGRICIRGTHLVSIDSAQTNSNITNGWLVSTGAEDGRANIFLTASVYNSIITGGILGIKVGDTADGTNEAWVILNPQPVLR